MRRAVLWLGSSLCLATLATAVASADGGSPVRIRDVRVGDHDGFERLVIELDADADVVWENGPEPGEESFYIAAAPKQKSRVIVTQLPHIGTISVTQMKGGTHVAVEPRVRRVRAYMMSGPPRLVVDFAPPAKDAFAAPAGSRALEPATTIGPLVLEPEPTVAPAPKPAPVKSAEPAPTPEPVATVEPEPTVEPAPTPAPVKAAEPAPAPEPAKAAEPAPTPEPAATLEPTATPIPEPAPTTEPAATPESAASAEPAPAPKPPAKTEPVPTPVAKAAQPSATAESDGFAFPYGLALAALVGLALVVAAGVALARRRSDRDESSGAWTPPYEDDELPATRVDEISPAEILAAGDHEGMLEKRLDEEVRARLELEQRFAGANEELKVLRDRLHRLERRREGAPS